MALLGGLIHVFNILETERLKKFTIYKVQMISFPKNEKLFHCLTKLTVTKRYSDFKKLEYDLQSIYKCYNFKRFFKSDTNYFKRYKNNYSPLTAMKRLCFHFFQIRTRSNRAEKAYNSRVFVLLCRKSNYLSVAVLCQVLWRYTSKS